MKRETVKTSMGQSITIACIKTYQRVRPSLDQFLYPVFGFSSTCKHKPTCSEYAITSIRRYGTIRGLITGIQRILRCT